MLGFLRLLPLAHLIVATKRFTLTLVRIIYCCYIHLSDVDNLVNICPTLSFLKSFFSIVALWKDIGYLSFRNAIILLYNRLKIIEDLFGRLTHLLISLLLSSHLTHLCFRLGYPL